MFIQRARIIFLVFFLFFSLTEGVYAMNGAPAKLYCLGRMMMEIPSGAVVNVSARYKSIELQGNELASNFEVLRKKLDNISKKMSMTNMTRDDYKDKVLKAGGLNPDAMYGRTQLIGYEVDEDKKTILIGYHKKLDDSYIRVELHLFVNGVDHIFFPIIWGPINFLVCDQIYSWRP